MRLIAKGRAAKQGHWSAGNFPIGGRGMQDRMKLGDCRGAGGDGGFLTVEGH